MKRQESRYVDNALDFGERMSKHSDLLVSVEDNSDHYIKLIIMDFSFILNKYKEKII